MPPARPKSVRESVCAVLVYVCVCFECAVSVCAVYVKSSFHASASVFYYAREQQQCQQWQHQQSH